MNDMTTIKATEPNAKQLLDWAEALDFANDTDLINNNYSLTGLEAWLRQQAQARATSQATDIGDGVEVINGKSYMADSKGNLIPLANVKVVDKLIDEVVRKIVGYALPLSAQVARFREHTFDDVDGLVALIAQEHGATVGGAKGNLTLPSYNGLMQVKLQSADLITFGPELQAAKALMDDYLRGLMDDSSEASRAGELRIIVNSAFETDKEGKINRGNLLRLRRYNIENDEWKKAIAAIDASIRVIGSKRYVRSYHRDRPDGDFKAIVIDVAAS